MGIFIWSRIGAGAGDGSRNRSRSRSRLDRLHKTGRRFIKIAFGSESRVMLPIFVKIFEKVWEERNLLLKRPF